VLLQTAQVTVYRKMIKVTSTCTNGQCRTHGTVIELVTMKNRTVIIVNIWYQSLETYVVNFYVVTKQGSSMLLHAIKCSKTNYQSYSTRTFVTS